MEAWIHTKKNNPKLGNQQGRLMLELDLTLQELIEAAAAVPSRFSVFGGEDAIELDEDISGTSGGDTEHTNVTKEELDEELDELMKYRNLILTEC